MEMIRATLPTLGEVDVVFHHESKEILEFFQHGERARLDSVQHLGPAACAFTGLNHTRWEYTLLQCALVQYVAVVFKNHPHIAMKGKVRLDGRKAPVSSGEELLKCWVLLGSAGHPQWTYGVERGLLLLAQSDREIRDWLSQSTRLPDLRRWIEEQLDSFNDTSMHYVLALRRIAYGAPYDRRKTAFAHLLRNRILPIDTLLADSPDDRSKLSRLRKLYARIRMLSLVTLDAYYSHKPLRVSLQTTLNGFGQIAGLDRDSEATDGLLLQMAAWLADNLYLHQNAVAVQLEYEHRVARVFPNRLNKARKSKRGESHLIANLFRNGLGNPYVGEYSPLLRLSFNGPTRHLLGPENLYVARRYFRENLCTPPVTEVCVSKNPFAETVHVDFFTQKSACIGAFAATWISVCRWLLRSIEADVIARLRRVVPRAHRSKDELDPMKGRLMAIRLRSNKEKLEALFHSVLHAMLPSGWRAVVSPFLPSEKESETILGKIRFRDLSGIDDLDAYLSTHLNGNPHGLERERLHELRGLAWMVQRTTASVVLGSVQPLRVYDGFGGLKDEWDATVLEIDKSEIRLSIFEGKSGGGAVARSNLAFKQLGTTREFLVNAGAEHRRSRVKGLGAVLKVRVAATQQER